MRYFICAGEASGDLHGADLIRAIRGRDPEAEFTLLGGDLMGEAAGVKPQIHYREMAYMGFLSVFRHLPQILHNMKEARRVLERERPDKVVLVDYPGFNIRLARYAHGLGLKVYYYIAPKAWAWKRGRIKTLRRCCHRVMGILPFEPAFFKRYGLEVSYVGNPTAQEMRRELGKVGTKEEFVKKHRLQGDKPILALLPGSRLTEIRANLPIMVAAAERFGEYQAVIAGAPAIARSFYRDYSLLPIVEGDTVGLLAHSRGAMVVSGTATLETAVVGTPQVAMYRLNGSRVSSLFRKLLIHCRFVTLPNLIADAAVIPELLLEECTAERTAACLGPLLGETPEREAMIEGYAAIQKALGDRNAAEEGAAIIVNE